jgi:hypothetical protein
MISLMDTESMRAHFRRIGEALDEDARELIAEAARLSPGERMLRGIRLSQAMLPDYRRLLESPAFAAAEDERALHKADLHAAWRRRP